MDISKLIEQLGQIPIDDYYKVMELAEEQDIQLEDPDDPSAAFKDAVIKLNEERQLPSWLSQWCIYYGVDHNAMEIEPPDVPLDI